MYEEVNCQICNRELNDELLVILQKDSQIQNTEEELICQQCINQEIVDLTQNNQELQDEINFYQNQLLSIQKETEDISEDFESSEKQQKLKSDLENKLKEKEQLSQLLSENHQKASQLINSVNNQEKQEQQYIQQINNLEKQLFDLEEKNSIAENHIRYLDSEIKRIQSINLIQDFFEISYQNEVGIINGLKLGKKIEDSYINWDETNAALGQIAQLMQFMKERLKLEFKLVEEIEVNGQCSRLIGRQSNLSFKDSYNLFSQGKEENNFQMGLYLLVQCQKEIHECLVGNKEVKENLRHYDIHDKLPHRIKEDHLDELPIYPHKGAQAKWDHWTEALKYFLTNLQHLILIFTVYHEIS